MNEKKIDNVGYIVRFVRRDGKPDEEYFYHTTGEALWHFEMFADDDSSLYTRIEVSRFDSPEKPELVRAFVEEPNA